MDIKKYVDYFHDGAVYTIDHVGQEMVLSMGSAEMDEDDLVDDVILSKDDRILGKLHIEGIKNIKVSDKPYLEVLTMKYENAEIADFEIDSNNVKLLIRWGSYPPNPPVRDFYILKIEAEKVWWENIPDLNCS